MSNDTKLSKKYIGTDQVGSAQIELENNQALSAKDAAGSSSIEVLKIDASDKLQLLKHPHLPAAATESSEAVRKAELDEVIADVEEAQADIIALEGDMAIALPKITLLESEMDQAQSDISALQSDMTEAQSDISALEGRMSTAESDIDAVEGRMATAESDIDSLEGRMNTAESDINALEELQDDYLKLDGSRPMVGNLNMMPELGTHYKVVGLGDPTDPRDAANKQYVDAIAEGLHVHAPAKVIILDSLAAVSGGEVSYDNGADGVGATLTTTVALMSYDSYNFAQGDRVIFNAEPNQAHNGIYTVGSDGAMGTVFTRALDFNTPVEIGGGDFIFIQEGALSASSGWVEANGVTQVGIGPIHFVKFSGAGTYSAGDALDLTGTEFSVIVDNSTIIVNASNQLELAPAVQQDLSGKVNKSGDEMSGTLTMDFDNGMTTVISDEMIQQINGNFTTEVWAGEVSIGYNESGVLTQSNQISQSLISIAHQDQTGTTHSTTVTIGATSSAEQSQVYIESTDSANSLYEVGSLSGGAVDFNVQNQAEGLNSTTSFQHNTISIHVADTNNNTASGFNVNLGENVSFFTANSVGELSHVEPSLGWHLTPKQYVDDQISDFVVNLQSNIDAVADDVSHLVTLSGVAVDSDHLGSFDENIIPDNQNVKQALQALESKAIEMSGISSDIQEELDATQVGAGLESDGSYAAPVSSYHLSSSVSLKDADRLLDIAINNETENRNLAMQDLQNELDATQLGAGLEAMGDYVAPVGSNYLGSAVSLKDADSKLDEAIKLVSDDVADLETYVDSTFVPLSQKGAADGIATLGPDSKIPSSQLPAIAITEVYVVADIAARDALTVDEGDVAKVIDAGAGLPKTFIFDGSIWIEIESGSDVDSVFGRTGNVVAQSGDYSASQISYGVGSNVEAKLDSIQGEVDALEELQDDYLSLDGSRPMAATLNMDSHLISNVLDPVSAQDAATKKYVDDADGLIISDLQDLDGYAQDIRSDLDDLDGYAQDIRSDLDQEVIDRTQADLAFLMLDGSRPMEADLDMDGFLISNVLDPVSAQDAATKAYVDAQLSASTDFEFIKITLSAQNITDQFVELPFLAAMGSITISSQRAALPVSTSADADCDFLQDNSGSVTKLVFQGPAAQPSGDAQLEEGQKLFINYVKA